MRRRSKNVALVAAMARACISGRELAQRAGLNPVTVSHLVNQRSDPKLATALAIARALGSSPSQLDLVQIGGAK